MARVPQEIRRGACLIHNTQDHDKLMEPLVIEVQADSVFYLLPGDNKPHSMRMKEALEYYTVVDFLSEEDLKGVS